MMMYDIHSAAAILARFKKLGVRLSLDDFGKGYSSLSYLKEFKVDTIKIDRSFVYDIDINPSSKALTNAITRLAHDLNMKVVAEGVETHQQLLMVKKSKCDVVQGFYYSRPLSPENADEFMNDKGVGQYA
jgi:EAL domain-containing protein (putative c-di-GMP-specific phosphodiesterase class I)